MMSGCPPGGKRIWEQNKKTANLSQFRNKIYL